MRKTPLSILSIIIGVALGIGILALIKGYICYQINIIDLLMLIATIFLAVAVVYLTRSLEKKDTARELVTADLLELCETLNSNQKTLNKLSSQQINIDEAKTEIRMSFHRGDLLTDMVNSEIKESFPKFLKSEHELANLITPYWKWLTDGDMQEANFTINAQFIRAHETHLRQTIAKIRLMIHRLVKNS